MANSVSFAISYGNGNAGVSHLHANFTVTASDGDEFLIARLAIISNFRGSARRFAARNLFVYEHGDGSAQAVIYDPPNGRGWSDHNGAWRLADVYPAGEITNDPPHYDSLDAAFGRQLVAAHRKQIV